MVNIFVIKKDIGWDIFSLDYKVDCPINTILNEQSMKSYLRIFNFLWRIKRVDYYLNKIWIGHQKYYHIVEKNREMKSSFKKCYIIRTEMIHFVVNIFNYLMVFWMF